MENSRPSYNWNWAEQEETAAAQSAHRARLLESWPQLPTYVQALSAGLNSSVDRPDLNDTTPQGFDGVPANIGFMACCMLNPQASDAKAWLEWATQGLEAHAKAQLSIEALEQIRLNYGPISLLQPGVTSAVLGMIRSFDGPANPWTSTALVALFQPIDIGMERAEDVFYAPCCRALLHAGARPDFRDPKGRSALSGLNQLLTESEVSMAEPSRVSDLMLCAGLLLDAGAHPDMVRPMPPLESLVAHENFRLMLLSRIEKESLDLYDSVADGGNAERGSLATSNKKNTRL